ncbi:response regulator [Nonomuraea sp. NPDC050556]|uniref:response regulator transcription factor n=1 Tax=Nonomuraea sp. NPDC050556 TaxID=3364369 RepID=UPI003794DDA8
MLSVLIVDDHPVVRAGLRGMLEAEPGLEVAGEAGSGDEAVAVAPRLRPDVILMDLRMPGGDGVSAIRRLPGHAVLVLTTFEGDVDAAVEAGAAGFVLKNASREDLVAAIRAVASGSRIGVRPRRAGPVLSARELEVIELVARGLTNPEIARRLFIGEATVKTHLLRIFAKLGVSDRTSAAITAMELGLVHSA